VVLTGYYENSLSQKQESVSKDTYDKKTKDRLTARTLERILCAKPIGVKYNFQDTPKTGVSTPNEPVRFCHALDIVKKTSNDLLITRESLSCKAAKYILGFEDLETLSESFDKLVEEKRFNERGDARKALENAPRITGPISSITLSVNDVHPDVFILYIKPVQFMLLVQAVHKMTTEPINLNVSSVVPVCGGCAVKPHVTQHISASFGCDDSREHGGINYDQFVVGIPYQLAGPLAETLEAMQ